jgi:heavy metal sensor kinase
VLHSRSIRFRLTAAFTAILACIFLLAGIGLWLTLQQSINHTADEELRSRLRALRSYVELKTKGSRVQHLVHELEEGVDTGAMGANMALADQSGKWLYRSPSAHWDLPLVDRKTLGNDGISRTLNVNGEHFRVLMAPLSIGMAQLGLSLHEFDEMLKHFAWLIGLVSPLFLALAALGGFWMSGRALKPVDRIATAATQISASNLSERLPSSKNGDELDRLSMALNRMLERLENAFNRITQFTADASHELRTPIAVIRTTAEVIGSRPRSAEEQERAWKMIVTQTERTQQLIENLLTLARADVGAGELTFEKVDLATLVADARDEMAIIANAKNITLSLLSTSSCTIQGDPEALHRLLLILLDNAVKFTAPGGLVQVSVRNSATGSPTAEIQIQDNGIGISQEDLPHIFDRFYRVSKDRSRKTGGAGLGLSIAQWIVDSHCGQIHVASVLGRGSIFSVSLPIE